LPVGGVDPLVARLSARTEWRHGGEHEHAMTESPSTDAVDGACGRPEATWVGMQ